MEWIIGGIIGFFIGGMFCWFIQKFRTRSTLDKESAKHNVEVAGLQARLKIDNAQRITWVIPVGSRNSSRSISPG